MELIASRHTIPGFADFNPTVRRHARSRSRQLILVSLGDAVRGLEKSAVTTRWTLPTLVLIAGGFLCDGLTEVGHHVLLIAGGVALGIGIGSESR